MCKNIRVQNMHANAPTPISACTPLFIHFASSFSNKPLQIHKLEPHFWERIVSEIAPSVSPFRSSFPFSVRPPRPCFSSHLSPAKNSTLVHPSLSHTNTQKTKLGNNPPAWGLGGTDGLQLYGVDRSSAWELWCHCICVFENWDEVPHWRGDVSQDKNSLAGWEQ